MGDVDPHWERHAANWLAWARTPGHDVYWHYRDAFFELVPPPAAATLEIGCGEGRVARDLAARGHRVTAIDGAPTLLEAAAAAHPDGGYLLADAAQLPFGAGAFDLVVAYNILMDVDDLAAVVAEAARVLRAGGHLCACVTHPFADAGRFSSDDDDAPFVVRDGYLASERFEEPFERDGLTMTFRGWDHPLEAYGRALEDAGLRLEALREPPMPDAAGPGRRRGHWQRLPMFLMFRAVR